MMITTAKPLPQHRLYLEFCSGAKLEINFSGLLDTIRFCGLKQQEKFNEVEISKDGNGVVFGDELCIGASELMNIALTPKENVHSGEGKI